MATEKETFKFKFTDVLRLRFSKGCGVLNIFNSDVGNYPLTYEIEEVIVNITTIKHLPGQSSKLCTDLSMFLNVLVQFLISMPAQKLLLKSEVLFHIVIKGS